MGSVGFPPKPIAPSHGARAREYFLVPLEGRGGHKTNLQPVECEELLRQQHASCMLSFFSRHLKALGDVGATAGSSLGH